MTINYKRKIRETHVRERMKKERNKNFTDFKTPRKRFSREKIKEKAKKDTKMNSIS